MQPGCDLRLLYSAGMVIHSQLPPRSILPMTAPRSRPGLTLLAAFLGWMFDGMEMGIFPLVAGPALRQMGGHTGIIAGSPAAAAFVQNWMGIITAFFLLGAAAGGLVFGWLGDRIGRVKAMTWSILFYSGFTGLCYFAKDPVQLAGLRFLAALGMGGEKISCSGELAPIFTLAIQRSDSGMKSRIRKVSAAGSAPTSITQRQELSVIFHCSAMIAMSA